MIFLTDEPLVIAPLLAAVDHPSCGAVVNFCGIVRNHHQGRAVDHLEYEAYEPMAIAKLEQIRDEVRERWGTDRVAIAHRVGWLAIGDTAVAIAVAAPHRAEAFEACRYIMDRIKQDVPIFKRETWADGSSEWVGPEAEGASDGR